MAHIVELKIALIQDEGADTYSLVLLITPDLPQVLAEGFLTPTEAIQALAVALTTAPPEIKPLEEELAALTPKVSELLTAQEEMAADIVTLGGRMNEVEEVLAGVQQPAAAPVQRRSLLPGRELSIRREATPPPPQRQPPVVRRPAASMTVQQGQAAQELHGRVHGQFFGGPSRRGPQPTADETGDE